MRFPWILLLLSSPFYPTSSSQPGINTAKLSPSDPTTLKRVLALDDNARQNMPLLRKADGNGGGSTNVTEERMIIVGMVRNKLRGIIARIKQAYRDFKTQVNNAKYDDWFLYGTTSV